MNYSSRESRMNWLKIAIVTIVILLVLAIVAAVIIRNIYNQKLGPVSASQQSQLITVQTGATAHDIALQLKQAGLIQEPWAFEWYVRSQGLREKLQAGTYYLRPNQGVASIVTTITNGKVATDLVTILPGRRLDQIRQALINAGYSKADVDTALEPAQYKNHPALVDKPASASLEGYLYPESFQKTATTKPEVIVKQSLDIMQKKLTPDVRAGFVKQGLTVHQGVIIASIVEQEVNKASDRPVVAQVFVNRLKKGMMLGSDVTAFYGAIIAGQEPSVGYDSPYNTRLHTGFPPGPISNVSDSSLRAVAFPASGDYLYFVAGDDGVTYFSRTLEEHQSLTKQHCKKLCG